MEKMRFFLSRHFTEMSVDTLLFLFINLILLISLFVVPLFSGNDIDLTLKLSDTFHDIHHFHALGEREDHTPTNGEQTNVLGRVEEMGANQRYRHVHTDIERELMFLVDPDQAMKVIENVKVYVYPDLFMSEGPTMLHRYGHESLFFQSLFSSHFITNDPWEADLFLLPSRCTAERFRHPDKDKKYGQYQAMYHLKKFVDAAIYRFPFWNRTLGLDHFYVCGHDRGCKINEISGRTLQKNAMCVTTTSDFSTSAYTVGKDVSMPPAWAGDTVFDMLSSLGQGGTNVESKRTVLGFFAGSWRTSGEFRKVMFQSIINETDFVIREGSIDRKEYAKYLAISRFCLCPRGWQVWSARITDALYMGCIPVLMANYYDLPFRRYIDWRMISVIIPEEQAANVSTILRGVSPQEVSEKQEAIARLFAMFTYNTPPKQGDALHWIVYQMFERVSTVLHLKPW